MSLSRRGFLLAAVGVAGGSILGRSPALARIASAGSPRYRRYNVASPQGRQMLKSYARGVQAMLALPANDPLNWFRHAFTHFLDCPHGNWWFYVWHRGYIGLFEQKIRLLSGDPSFTLPFWDWTTHPDLPAQIFDGVLTPTAQAFEPYTGNLQRFRDFMDPGIHAFWDNLSEPQRKQLEQRGYRSTDDLWNDVTNPKGGIGDVAFAVTSAARYPTRANPGLNASTLDSVSQLQVVGGLKAGAFNDRDLSANSFTSKKTDSHGVQPAGRGAFSLLEGVPHNTLHNFIGGSGSIDPGPYGNMTNNLSPVDPIFFLHHANMDRLWDVWTRRQTAMGLPVEPAAADREAFMAEQFLFFVDVKGKPVSARAQDYFSTAVFDYDYDKGFGEDVPLSAVRGPQGVARHQVVKGAVKDGVATLLVPAPRLRGRFGADRLNPVLAEVTVQRLLGTASPRQFTILINAPATLASAEPGSPFYAGTVSFFGPAHAHAHSSGQDMTQEATFVVALPPTLKALANPSPSQASVKLEVRAVPSHGSAGGSSSLVGFDLYLP